MCARRGVWGLGRLVRPLLLRVRRGELEQQGARDLQRHRRAGRSRGGRLQRPDVLQRLGDGRPHDRPDRHGRGRRRVRGRAGERECVDPRRRRPDERVGLVQRRRRGRPAQGHDGARRDRPDRLRPGHRVGDGPDEHGRQHAPPQAPDRRRRHEWLGRVRPVHRVGWVRDRHVRRARRAHGHRRQRTRRRHVPAAARRAPGRCGNGRGLRDGRRWNGHVADPRPGLSRRPRRARSRSPASRRQPPSAAPRAGR